MKTLQPPAVCKSDRMTARGGVCDPICNSLSGVRCDTVQLPIGRGSDSSLVFRSRAVGFLRAWVKQG